MIIARMAKQRWQAVSGPSTVFAIAPAGRGQWLLGSNEGVWQYADGSCTIVSEALRPAAITAVAASPTYPHHPVALVGAADGIARSPDQGATWVGATMPQRSQISQIVMSPAFEVDGVAFAATLQDGVLCTADYGENWKAWNFGLLDMETLSLAVSPNHAQDETVIAATVHGVFRSTNGGHAWRALALPAEVLPLAGLAFSTGMLVAGSESQGVFYSPDLGATWGRRPTFKSGQINAVAASPDGKVLAIATPTVVAASTDQGATWNRSEGHVPRGIISLVVDGSGTLMCGTQEEGLWAYA